MDDKISIILCGLIMLTLGCISVCQIHIYYSSDMILTLKIINMLLMGIVSIIFFILSGLFFYNRNKKLIDLI